MALNTWKPFLTVVSLQFGYAGLSIIAKFALDRGMSPHVLAAYRHIVATVFIAPFAFFLDRYSIFIYHTYKLYYGHACACIRLRIVYVSTYLYHVYVFFTKKYSYKNTLSDYLSLM